jgi:tetratricopeptide (TPR) repeat protein
MSVRPLSLMAGIWLLSACAAQAQQDGSAALRAGRYEEAIGALRRGVQSADAPPNAFREYARALIEVGRYGDAEQMLRAAPAHLRSATASQLGGALRHQGKYAAADSAFRVALTGEDSLVARLNLALLQYERGERAAALDELDRFIDVYNRASGRLTSEQLAAVATACRYLGARDPQLFKDAIAAFDEAIAADPYNYDARVQLGRLFLEKYNSGDAKTAFQQVLERNPAHADALLGMARVLEFDNAPGVVEAARKALVTNPNHVAAHAFLSRTFLAQDQFDSAAVHAERAAAVNAIATDAVSALAVLHYARAETRQLNDMLAHAPVDVFVALGEAAVQRRQYRAAVDFAQRAIAADSSSGPARAILGINLMRVGDIAGSRNALEQSFARDPYNVWVKNSLDMLDRVAGFNEYRTPHFIIVAAPRDAAIVAAYAGELAEGAFEKLKARYGYTPQTPIRLELFDRHADFSVRTVGLAGLGALGVSFGNVLAMDAPSARAQGAFNWGSTLWHELAHAFHLGMTEHRVPRWFTEGLAVLEERRARAGWGDDVSPAFLNALRTDRILKVRDINSGFARPSYPEQVGVSYFQASLLLELIERDFGAGAITALLRAFGTGKQTESALRDVLKLTPEELDARFDKYVRERYRTALAIEPSAFAEALKRGRDLFNAKSDEAVTHLETTRAVFPEYTGPDTPYWYLAQIYTAREDWKRAEAELNRLVSLDESNYEAPIALADVRERLGDQAGTIQALESALYVYPYDPAVHARLAALYGQAGDHLHAVRAREVVVALEPSDRAEALYQLAVAHLDANDATRARRAILQALEIAPGFEKAQALLLKVRSQ